MARGFGSGVGWGLAVAVIGLATWSQLAPPPQALVQAEAEARAAEEKAAAEKAAAEAKAADEKAAAEAKAAEEKASAAAKAAEEKAAAEAKAAEEKAAAEKAAAEKAAAEEKEAAEKAAAALAEQHKLDTEAPASPEAAPEPAPEAAPEAAGAPPVVVAQGPTAAEPGAAPAQPLAPAAQADLPSLTGLDQALTAPEAEAAPAPADPAPEAPGDVLLQPGQPKGQAQPEQLPQIAPIDESQPAPPGPSPDSAEPAAPEAAPQPDAQATLPGEGPLEDKLPTTVLDKQVPGVRTGELPQIGKEPAPEAQAEAAPAPEDLAPVQRYARDFTPEGKPLFAILLRDIGARGMPRQDLVSLPFPVSVVIDPLDPEAKAAMAEWRAAGQEVLTLANGIPEGAEAQDIETTFATLAAILPESVALVDQDLGGFQDDRPLATMVLPVIAGQGRGLVTWDRGLNAADQIARREGVPQAVIFRRLDGEGESPQVIRRYLDRAAFKAAQEGMVVVIGDTRPETVAAILEWTVEGKASTVSLAPITALMAR